MHQIAGMVDFHTREPFKGGGGNIIIITDPEEGRIGMKAGQHRIDDGWSHELYPPGMLCANILFIHYSLFYCSAYSWEKLYWVIRKCLYFVMMEAL
ncbi:hypothetical protein D3C75_1079410 [compost metagenome]